MKKCVTIILCFSIVILFGCGNKGSYDLRPVDDLSRSVKNAVNEDFDFHGLNVDDNGRKYYSYEINEMSAGAIGNLVKTFNDSNLTKGNQISLNVVFPISSGAWAAMFFMQNYSVEEGGIKIYDGMYYLHIKDQIHFSETACNPELYSEIEGIRELHIDKAIQDKAYDMGIDWYNYWPDLETIVIEEN
ncbi:MAG: hypothetical protein K6B69_14640 [Lachnospiraceae bacterium]|nr:hypothetical protein [Lachnospiraceae bacterium]